MTQAIVAKNQRVDSQCCVFVTYNGLRMYDGITEIYLHYTPPPTDPLTHNQANIVSSELVCKITPRPGRAMLRK